MEMVYVKQANVKNLSDVLCIELGVEILWSDFTTY